jgi:hypothetical protein
MLDRNSAIVHGVLVLGWTMEKKILPLPSSFGARASLGEMTRAVDSSGLG